MPRFAPRHASAVVSALVFGVLALVCVGETRPAAQSLSRDVRDGRAAAVDQVVREAERAGVRVGVAVVDFPSGESWLERRSGETFLPASNQKLLTVVAALAELGPNHEFATEFELRDGFLLVHPGGDPNWRTGSEHQPSAQFDRVADWLRARGVDALRGLRCLDGPYGGARDIRPSGWPEDQASRTYCAPGGGLLLDAGCVAVEIRPEPEARRAAVRVVSPPGPWTVRGKGIRMTADKKKGSVYGVRQKGAAVTPFGHFWTRGRQVTVRASIDDPAAAFERALRAHLAARGIRCGKASVPELRVGGSARPDSPALVIRTPLVDALDEVLADSSNVHAEQVLRAVGVARRGDGTIDGGCAAVCDALEDFLGPERGDVPRAIDIVDGSGLSRGNRVTPEFVVTLVARALHADFASTLLDALAVGGGARGTLRRRFTSSEMKGRVRGKTGTIRRVSALSGVVRARDDRLQVFSILMNVDRKGARVSSSKMRGWQDRITRALAGIEG